MGLSTLLALALAAGTVGPPAPVSGRIEGIALVPYEGRLAVRLNYTGRHAGVSVSRSGNSVTVTFAQTELGWRFGSGRRFEWRPDLAPVRAFPTAVQSVEVLQIEQTRGETSLVFELPADVTVDLRQARYAVLVVLRQAGAPGALVADAPRPVPPPAPAVQTAPAPTPVAPPPTLAATASAPRSSAPTPAPAAEPMSAPAPAVSAPVPPPAPEPVRATVVTRTEPVEPAPAAPPAAPAAPVTPAAPPATDLYRQLFPAASSATASAETGDDTTSLYTRLFPEGTVAAAAPEEERTSAVEKAPEHSEGFPAGPFRLRPTFTVSYVDADASLLATPGTVRDRYFQFEPGLVAQAPVREGSFTAEYAPSFRAGASFSATSTPTHILGATLSMPFGSGSQLTLQDRFVVSTLDSREADPGGEYFFDLARFNRNLASANARIGFAPRLFVELGGAYNHVSFDESGGFFGYDSRLASAGLGYELSPNLRLTGSYTYDDVPAPEDRPEAEATAHSALVGLDGDILPLLTGRLALGYRDQKSPNGGAGGQRYQGFTMTGALSRELGRESSISVLLNRSTPVSNFESNAFYVNTSIQGALSAALPWNLSFEGGLGYVWNDYETPSLELGVPREDRILGFFAGLRRPVAHRFWVSAFYRRERRQSNLATFDTTSDGFLVEVNWGLFGPRR